MTRLRSAVLGCGPRANYHARVYAEVKHGELVACCDLNEERLATFGGRFGISARYTDFRKMMRETKPDLLHIVTAPSVRWPVVEQALEYPPRAILIEKPLACRPEEGQRILDACRDAGVELFVNHQLRHHRPHIELREAIQAGELGEIEWVRASCRGNILEQGTHLFDLVSFVFGDPPVEWVLAQAAGAAGYDGGHSAPDFVAGTLMLAGGLRVSFECGPPAPVWKGEREYWWNVGIEVAGSKGRAGASINHGWWLRTGEAVREHPVPYGEEDDRAQGRLIDSILAAIQGGREEVATHPNNAARSAVSFHVAMAAQISALHRVPVRPAAGAASDDAIERLRAELKAAEAAEIPGRVRLGGR